MVTKSKIRSYAAQLKKSGELKNIIISTLLGKMHEADAGEGNGLEDRLNSYLDKYFHKDFWSNAATWILTQATSATDEDNSMSNFLKTYALQQASQILNIFSEAGIAKVVEGSKIRLTDIKSEPSLFVSDRKTTIATGKPLVTSTQALMRPERWKKDREDSSALFDVFDKNNHRNFIEHSIRYPGDASLLPWDQAQQIIDKFGLDTAKLQFIFAAHATRQVNPWSTKFVLKGSDIIQELGWETKHRLTKAEKLLHIAKLAWVISCLTVKADWEFELSVRGKKHKILTQTTLSAMWNVKIDKFGQRDLDGEVDNPTEVFLTVTPGGWTESFLNQNGYIARNALNQFGYLAEETLKIDPTNNELALRLALHLTLESRIRMSGSYSVRSLLQDVLPSSEIEDAQNDFHKAYKLKSKIDSALLLLHNLGWQVIYDDATYPEEFRPNTEKKRLPKGYFEKLLTAKLTIKPKSDIQAKLANISKLEASPLKAITPQTTSPQTEIITGEHIYKARKAAGISQTNLAAAYGVTPAWLCMIEKGSRNLKPKDAKGLIKAIASLEKSPE